MNDAERTSGIVGLTRGVKNAVSLDRVVGAVEPSITSVFGTGRRASLLPGGVAWPCRAPMAHRRRARALDLRQHSRSFRRPRRVDGCPETDRYRIARRRADGMDRVGRVD